MSMHEAYVYTFILNLAEVGLIIQIASDIVDLAFLSQTCGNPGCQPFALAQADD